MSDPRPYSLRDIRAHALAATAPPRPRDILGTITLTTEEDKVCSLLDEFTKQLRSTSEEYAGVECRIAGGWVRDKVSPTAFLPRIHGQFSLVVARNTKQRH